MTVNFDIDEMTNIIKITHPFNVFGLLLLYVLYYYDIVSLLQNWVWTTQLDVETKFYSREKNLKTLQTH